jgi:hypothetical protein
MITRVEGLVIVLALSVSTGPALLFILYHLFFTLASTLQLCFITSALHALISSLLLLFALRYSLFHCLFSSLFTTSHLTSPFPSTQQRIHCLTTSHPFIHLYHIHTQTHIITLHPFHSFLSMSHLHLFI